MQPRKGVHGGGIPLNAELYYKGGGDYLDIAGITQLISSIGFPCVMCLLLLKYMNKMQDALITSVEGLKILVKEMNDKIDRN